MDLIEIPIVKANLTNVPKINHSTNKTKKITPQKNITINKTNNKTKNTTINKTNNRPNSQSPNSRATSNKSPAKKLLVVTKIYDHNLINTFILF